MYPKDIDVVIGYIENQKEHHQRQTFQDEYRLLMHEQNMEFDERYVWD